MYMMRSENGISKMMNEQINAVSATDESIKVTIDQVRKRRERMKQIVSGETKRESEKSVKRRCNANMNTKTARNNQS